MNAVLDMDLSRANYDLVVGDKHATCPQCGNAGPTWHYDAQVCQPCENARVLAAANAQDRRRQIYEAATEILAQNCYEVMSNDIPWFDTNALRFAGSATPVRMATLYLEQVDLLQRHSAFPRLVRILERK